jgi:hypothetical protein
MIGKTISHYRIIENDPRLAQLSVATKAGLRLHFNAFLFVAVMNPCTVALHLYVRSNEVCGVLQ